MNGHLRIRFLVIFFVAALSVGLFLTRGINLGLDLRGGVLLILDVVTDDAVRAEADRAIQTIGPEVHAARAGDDRIDLAGVDAHALLDRLPGWDAITNSQLRLGASEESAIRNRAVEQAKLVIRRRLDGLGVGEVNIQNYGAPTDYEILVEAPGTEPDRVKSIVRASAVLELKLVDAGPFPTPEAALQHYRGSMPAALELMEEHSGVYYAVEKAASISGSELKDAYRSRDENGRDAVGFTLTRDGARRFGDLTERNIGRLLAVVLDDRIQSAARIEMRITDSGIIRGGGAGFRPQEASDLALVLRSGALPTSIHYSGEETVGPLLGADSIRQGVQASAVALGGVLAFMLFYYRGAGVNAGIAMVMNLVILLGSMAYFRAALTLPGIAGIILTIGVGIDSNVLVFERIREEIRFGKPPASAVNTAFQRVFLTLVDTHLAALISAAFLFLFGTGAIRGFAVTLVIGLVSNMFTSIFVSRTLFEWVLHRAGRGSELSI
jgi:preprotein translocase subunit SecD